VIFRLRDDGSSVQRFVDDLASNGRSHFGSEEVRATLGVSPAAAKLSLLRLAKQGLVASPARGFYVIVPPEYRRLGCLPADQFIPQLMERLKLPSEVLANEALKAAGLA